MLIKFDLSIQYTTLALFEPTLENPFNEFREQHWLQGFSWRPEAVSFRTLKGFDVARVEVVEQATVPALNNETIRAIRVPFVVQPSGLVEVTSIDRGKVIALSRGNYALTFETGYDNRLFE